MAKARRIGHGHFEDYFENSYDFRPAVWSLGDATLEGKFSGHVKPIDHRNIKVYGVAHIEFLEVYKDILSFDRSHNHNTDAEIIGQPYKITDAWQIIIDEIG